LTPSWYSCTLPAASALPRMLAKTSSLKTGSRSPASSSSSARASPPAAGRRDGQLARWPSGLWRAWPGTVLRLLSECNVSMLRAGQGLPVEAALPSRHTCLAAARVLQAQAGQEQAQLNIIVTHRVVARGTMRRSRSAPAGRAGAAGRGGKGGEV
jgi:hypothetical protein